ncbi:hypothetical protein DNTS_016547 [Danionella cerebrum]|uniref:Uncharacterized protein n=1 Tax=Danionella cerebrum TaxID=2873325 RepID=A0A553R1H4_9TELE|nr:hypothetical protein DNTS_016547 [Danionella translucida]
MRRRESESGDSGKQKIHSVSSKAPAHPGCRAAVPSGPGWVSARSIGGVSAPHQPDSSRGVHQSPRGSSETFRVLTESSTTATRAPEGLGGAACMPDLTLVQD